MHDLNDAARLSTDPTCRLIGSPTRWDRSAALTSTLHLFEAGMEMQHVVQAPRAENKPFMHIVALPDYPKDLRQRGPKWRG